MEKEPQASLPFDDEEINALFESDDIDEKNEDYEQNKPLQSVVMPSLDSTSMPHKRPHVSYHDLELIYPEAPVSGGHGTVVHRADLIEEGGVTQLMDWAADGDVSVVELRNIVDSPELLADIVRKLTEFIVDDMHGELLQLTETRLLVLPPECKGLRGLADEAFT